jgi:hypothetical protein
VTNLLLKKYLQTLQTKLQLFKICEARVLLKMPCLEVGLGFGGLFMVLCQHTRNEGNIDFEVRQEL